jgi:ribonuclease R
MERPVVKGITIDSAQTRDIDDALWIEQRDDGFWHVVVSIADVAEAIPPGGKFDERAREMVTTKYFATGNSPMLPRQFAEDQLSLWPNKERKTLTIDMALGTDSTNVVRTEIYPSVLKSQARITYDRIPEILKDKTHEWYGLLDIGTKLAMRLLDARRKAGAMVLYDLNNGWVSTEEGFLRKLEKKEETIGYILVQEMMVLANAKVAEFCVKENIPVLYRNHMAMSAMPDRGVLMGQIQDALATPFADLETVRQRTHMLLGRASYSDSLLGHYGLNLPAYLHFTSPIRRYADLVTHRQIKAHLGGKPLPYTKKDIEEVSLHINDVIELEREQASFHFKTKDEELARRNIDARRLDGLDAVHFERATKVEVRSGRDPSEAFAESFLLRLKENRLPLIALTVILTQELPAPEGWEPIRQAIIDHLAKKPEDAVSLLAQAQQVADWPLVEYEMAHEGPDHARTFEGKAMLLWQNTDRDKAWSGTGVGNTSKLAKGRAAVDLLAVIGGQKAPTPKEVLARSMVPGASGQHCKGDWPTYKELQVVRLAVAMPDKALVVGSTGAIVHIWKEGEAFEVEFITKNGHELLTLKPEQIMPLDAPVPEANTIGGQLKAQLGGKDPVSALMEYVAKSKTQAPNFSFDQSGPSHIPTITCTCRLGTIMKTATAPTKSDAKKQAAKAVLDSLFAELSV